MSQTAYRTHHATEVTEALVGQKVTLAGWVDRRRDHGGVAFIDLRDSTGLVQVVIYDEDMARPLRSEFVIQITGEVRLRPDGHRQDRGCGRDHRDPRQVRRPAVPGFHRS